MMIIKYIEAAILLVFALTSDIKTYKIRNNIVFSAAGVGLATNFVFGGLGCLISSFWAFIIPIFLLIILFALRMLGAGDIKLFGAIGAILGLRFVLYSIVYSFLSGGIIALILIIMRKNGKERFKNIYEYLKGCFISFRLLPYSDFNNKSDGSKFRFAYAIVAGTLIQAVFN